MDRSMEIQEGMQVYGAGDKLIGRVERLHGDGFHVEGQHYSRDQIGRIAQNRIYLRETGRAAVGATGMEATEGQIRVPVAEERLAVGKREVELGEVEIRKTVTEEEQTASVTLRRDEVRIEEVEIADRPVQPGDDAFNEGTIRVQLRGEEAVVGKETVVTGEVVIDKESVSEERQITDTVRRQRVEVEEHYEQARAGFEQAHQARGIQGRTFEQAEPNYRAGYTAAHDERYANREFEDVEPELRQSHGGSGENWEHLRHEIREGWNHARNR